jgi:hypothetical protein
VRGEGGVRGVSPSSTRGTSPRTLLSFLEERTRAARSWDERVLEVGGGRGNATDDMVLVVSSWCQTRSGREDGMGEEVFKGGRRWP